MSPMEQNQEEHDSRSSFFLAKQKIVSALSRMASRPSQHTPAPASSQVSTSEGTLQSSGIPPALLNDASIILPGRLMLSSCQVERSAALLQHLGVSSVLQIGVELNPSHVSSSPLEGRIKYLCVKIMDFEGSDLVSHLPACLKYLEEEHAKNRTVLVHCVAGISRSASVVAAYLMWKQGLSFNDARAFIKEKRPIIFPNQGFKLQLLEFERLGKEGRIAWGDTASLQSSLQQHWRPWDMSRFLEAQDQEGAKQRREQGTPEWMDTD